MLAQFFLFTSKSVRFTQSENNNGKAPIDGDNDTLYIKQCYIPTNYYIKKNDRTTSISV